MPLSNQRENFARPTDEQRPIYYFNLPSPTPGSDFKELLISEVEKCRSCGCSTLIPQLPIDTEIDDTSLRTVQEMYAVILQKAHALRYRQ